MILYKVNVARRFLCCIVDEYKPVFVRISPSLLMNLIDMAEAYVSVIFRRLPL